MTVPLSERVISGGLTFILFIATYYYYMLARSLARRTSYVVAPRSAAAEYVRIYEGNKK